MVIKFILYYELIINYITEKPCKSFLEFLVIFRLY